MKYLELDEQELSIVKDRDFRSSEGQHAQGKLFKTGQTEINQYISAFRKLNNYTV